MVFRTASGGNVPGRFGARAIYGGGGTSLPAIPQSGSIVARWSANDITPQSDNTNLVTWTDSINGAAATNATGIRQPKYRTNVLNGLPAVQFSGGQVLDCGRPTALATAMDNNSERTIFVVYKTLGATSNGMLFSAANGGGAGYMMIADQTNVGLFGANNNVPSAGGAFMTVGNSSHSNLGGFAGTAHRIAVNGGVVHGGQVAAPTSAGNTISIGGINLNNSFFVNAYIFDVIVWNTGLTPPELAAAHAWACAKYGQTTPWASQAKYYIFDGDSITEGAGGQGQFSYPYKVAASLGLVYGQWTNIGVSGITTPFMTAKAPLDLAAYGTVIGLPLRVAAFEYYNQKGLGAGTIETNTIAYANYIRSLPTTKLLWGSSTSSAVDPDATRNAYNTWLDANNATYFDGYVALHTDTNIGIPTAYATNGAGAGLNLYADTVHPNNAGNVFLAADMQAGLVAMG